MVCFGLYMYLLTGALTFCSALYMQLKQIHHCSLLTSSAGPLSAVQQFGGSIAKTTLIISPYSLQHFIFDKKKKIAREF